jgi:hypothetical protein
MHAPWRLDDARSQLSERSSFLWGDTRNLNVQVCKTRQTIILMMIGCGPSKQLEYSSLYDDQSGYIPSVSSLVLGSRRKTMVKGIGIPHSEKERRTVIWR